MRIIRKIYCLERNTLIHLGKPFIISIQKFKLIAITNFNEIEDKTQTNALSMYYEEKKKLGFFLQIVKKTTGDENQPFFRNK